MKFIAIIPARYGSTRFEGKPLADICGRPMLWWVYHQVKKVTAISEVYVATDDCRISKVCEQYGMNYIMTSDRHPNHISRVHEVSENIPADLYICVNGDEPLIESEVINSILPDESEAIDKRQVFGLMRDLTDPAETIDFANIKIVTNQLGEALYMSRNPIPYPKGSLFFKYKKYVGVEGFTKEALDFFVEAPQSELEKIEDIDHLRFLDNGIRIRFKKVESHSLSVDTPKDLEKVRAIFNTMEERKSAV